MRLKYHSMMRRKREVAIDSQRAKKPINIVNMLSAESSLVLAAVSLLMTKWRQENIAGSSETEKKLRSLDEY